MFEKFTSDAREAVIAAQREARHLKATRIEPVHVFLGVIASAKPGLRDALVHLRVGEIEVVRRNRAGRR